MTSALALNGVTKTFGTKTFGTKTPGTKTSSTVTAVESVDLELSAGSFTALLGPSGCGKSTMLQLIAGLIEPDAGLIELDGDDLGTTPTERRPISLVFQKPLLFPHLTVAQNVGFGLRMQGTPKSEIADRVADLLDQVQLGQLARRRPHELSGGQEQRVALARALVLRPRLLLLDEPFSQLDASLRAEMRALVRELHDATGVTTLFVTHDQGEAVEIADRIVLMVDGAIEATGSPEDLWTAPPSLTTARFLGAGNELRGVADHSGFRLGDAVLPVLTTFSGPAVLVVRPETLGLVAPTRSDVTAIVDAVRFAGSHLVVSTRTDDGQLIVVHVPGGTRVDAGQRVGVLIAPEACSLFAEDPR